MSTHAVVIAGAGPTGLMLAGELALAGVDVAIAERRAGQGLDGPRSRGLHARTVGVFTLLHGARPVLLHLGEPGGLDITPWADRVRLIDAGYAGEWNPAGPAHPGLADALTKWFGTPGA